MLAYRLKSLRKKKKTKYHQVKRGRQEKIKTGHSERTGVENRALKLKRRIRISRRVIQTCMRPRPLTTIPLDDAERVEVGSKS